MKKHNKNFIYTHLINYYINDDIMYTSFKFIGI